MNHTQNYNLNQWVKSDQVKMEDFNADNAKIDTALGALASQVSQKAEQSALSAEADARAAADAALTTELSKRGNCRIWTTTYTGNGQITFHRSVSFPKTPKIAFVVGGFGFMPLLPGMDRALSISSANTLTISSSWSGSRVSWYGGSESWVAMNTENVVYTVVALLEA